MERQLSGLQLHCRPLASSISSTSMPPAPVNGSLNMQEGKLWRSGDPPEYVETMPPSEGTGSPLDQIYKRMQRFDQGMRSRRQDEIEHLLIFAGLFSATVTAFIIDSYKWLRPDSTEVSAQLLSQISLQLSAIANNATLVSASTVLDEAFRPTPRIVRINILWFTSLALCLSTVIFGILCLYWVREYTLDMSLCPADAIAISQMRYDGLLGWKVPTIIDWLPAILQFSVLLFFSGLLDLLWSINTTVAAIITAVVGLVTVAVIFTTLAPVVQTITNLHHFIRAGHDPQAYVAPCPYRSPFSWLVLRLIVTLDPALSKQRYLWSSWAAIDIFSHERSLQAEDGSKAYNVRGLAQALKCIMARLSPELNQGIPREVYHMLHNAVDRVTSGAILLDWAELTGEARNLKTTLEDLHSSGMYQAQYDLLMERLLRKTSPVQENRKVLLELQVRCLNTLGDRKIADMGEIFSDAVHNCYYYLLENKDARSLNNDGLLFQSLMTIMKFYTSLHDYRRMSNVCIGSVLDTVIRHTQVKESNASLCYQVLNQFELMLDGVYQRVGDFSTPVPNQNLISAVRLLLKLDLHAIKKWQMDIERITENYIPLVDELIPYMDMLVQGPEAVAGEVRRQLDAFRKGQPWRCECVL